MRQNSKVFEPITINGMSLKNRIGLAPLLNMPRAADWGVSDKTITWFEARARGGAGFLMTGTLLPLMVFAPNALERFARLAEKIHEHGAKIAVQLGAGGPMGGQGPSPEPYPDDQDPKPTQFEIHGRGKLPVAVLSVEQIHQHIDAFARAAAMLKQTGIDAVELHCAHGGATLCCSFISPFYNRREDEYGGTWENRLRFPTEILKKMREALGHDYPLLARISADELLGPRGITLDDTLKHIVPAMEEAGVDCLDVSQGSITHTPGGITIPLYYPRGCYIEHAAAVKKVSRLPVIGVGRILDLNMANRFLEEGKADIIYMGRQLTADPETPNKYWTGREDEIRKCIGCLEGCGTPCPINYDIQPDPIPLVPAGGKKKVLIIGGGVAGMEAARVCALRGHEVSLFEKNNALGGTVAVLSNDPLLAEFRNIVDYLGVQMRKLGVDVRVCKEATIEAVAAVNPEAVILAAGASLIKPRLAEGQYGVLDHLEALRQRQAVGTKVVVWGLVFGAELAISLAEEGREVTLIGEAGPKAMGSHASNDRKFWIWRKLSDINAVRATPEAVRMTNPRVLTNITVAEVSARGLKVVNRAGASETVPYDTLIISRGRRSNDALFEELKGRSAEVYKIGDCDKTANIHRAIWSANEVARKI